MRTINWKNAIIAGIAGTILFDVLGFILTGQWWDIPNLLGNKTGLGSAYGVFGHYGNGILLAVLYAGIAPSLWGPYWLRPFIFITAHTIVLVWLFMFPLLGAGVAGSNAGPMKAIGSLLRHWIYVVPFIFLINKDYLKIESKT
ncbi:hypothetical protein QWY93_06865 [Echinicola jeungdonensis]|uniref:DUF2938 family protein n=1 Tax=Echinicola jeungdonensis TaxID=709343 RepID=A0ABV5J251_9BACT|nr:hypothetical protein [Echinicola jeungdonensis]MDN3669043.1 hypothetical protein [Echinicola jeungdonensis]